MTTRALVTGGTGFIGKHLVRALCARGDDVTCLVRDPARAEDLRAFGASLVTGDILAPDSLAPAMAEVDVVYHLAALLKAPWRRSFLTTNARGAGAVAEACARAERPPVLVLVSSLAAAGVSRAGPRLEADPPAPVSRYGRAKLAGEEAAAAFADRVPLTIVRPPMVFGEGDAAALELFRMVRGGWLLQPVRARRQVSLVHAADLCDLLVAAADRGERVPAAVADRARGTGVYYAAYAEAPTLAELGAEIASVVARPAPRVMRVPYPVTWCAGAVGEAVGRLRDRPTMFNLDKAREIGAGSWVCSPRKAQDELGFAPAPLAERLAQTAAWYDERGWTCEGSFA